MQHKNNTYQSVRKALNILLAFAPLNQEMGTLELSKNLGLHKSAVSRMLTVLKDTGFVQQNPDNKKYRLGPAIPDLEHAIRQSLHSNLLDFAKPYLNKLRNKLGETTAFSIPSNDGVTITYLAEGYGPIRVKSVVGTKNPYHAGAGGKAILAFSSPEFQGKIMSDDLIKKTPHTITDPHELRKELAKVRHQGFAFDRQENNVGVQAFGIPVIDHEEMPVASVVVAGASEIVTWAKRSYFIPKIKEVAEEISSIFQNEKQLSNNLKI